MRFLVEYIHEFIETNWRHLHLKKYSELNVRSLIQHFQSKYPYIDKMPVHIVSGRKSLYVNTVYDAIKFLSEIGYTTIPYPYPAKVLTEILGWYMIFTLQQRRWINLES